MVKPWPLKEEEEVGRERMWGEEEEEEEEGREGGKEGSGVSLLGDRADLRLWYLSL